jgi:hypothetical protein
VLPRTPLNRKAKKDRDRYASALLIALIHRSAWKKNSPKFAVASGFSTQWQALDNRPRCTPLGSKRLRLGSRSCTIVYQGVATRNGATTREILAWRLPVLYEP